CGFVGVVIHFGFAIFQLDQSIGWSQFWLKVGISFLELVLWFNFIWSSWRNASMIIFLTNVFSYTLYSHVKECNQMLSKLVSSYKKHPRMSADLRDLNRLKHFIAEHTKMCHLLDLFSCYLLSLIIFSTLIIMIPANIYFIYRLIFYHLNSNETIQTVLIIAFKLSLFGFLMIPLAY